MAQKVRDVMTPNPLTLPADANIVEAAKRMRDADIGDVLVTESGNGKLCGIVTDRDIVVRGLANGKKADQVKLDDVCTKKLVTISPDEDVTNAVNTMRHEHIRRIAVVENNKPVGIVSLGDLAAARDPQSALGEISTAPPTR